MNMEFEIIDEISNDLDDAEIYNDEINAAVNGTDDNDVIENEAGGVTIRAGKGDDYIYSSTSEMINDDWGYVTIDGGEGNDTIELDYNGENVIEYALGDGNDVILGITEEDMIHILDDTEHSTMIIGDDVIVNVGSGSMRLVDAAYSELQIVVGKITERDGEEIYNEEINVAVSGTDKNDVIENEAGGVIIRAGDGNDYIHSSTSETINDDWGFVTIEGGAGNDTIYSEDPNVSIVGGAGNDYIETSGYSSVTVNGGDGNDTIDLYGAGENVIEYKFGDGNDQILGISWDDTIRILDGAEYSTMRSGEDVIVSLGSGSMRLVDALDMEIEIIDGDFNNLDGEEIYNEEINVAVNGTDKNDSITNEAGGVTIRAGDGNDSIYSSTSETINDDWGYVTIDAGAGNDMIESCDPHVSINGGDGDDYIDAGGYSNVTALGGAGNDTIDLDGSGENVIEYKSGDGNDLILGFTSDDTIRITDDASFSTMILDDDVIVSLGSGSITLIDAAYEEINILGGTNNNPDGTVRAVEDDVNANYWFTKDETLIDSQSIEQIIPIENAVALNFDQMFEAFKPKNFEMIVSHSRKKLSSFSVFQSAE